MMGWPMRTLGELCSQVTVGFVGKMADQYIERGVPFLRSQDILAGRIDVSRLKYISPEFHNRIRKSRLVPGDVGIVRTGYPGTAAVVPQTLREANCSDLVIARPGPDLDPRYLAYLLNSPWGRAMIRGRLVGAAQQHFNVKVAQALEIPTPPIWEQSRIASILGAYDDLIEVNRRRVAVLEAMARGLFEEWFVQFRFPGHEAVTTVNTPDGMLPYGFRSELVGDVFEMLGGGTPRKTIDEYWQDGSVNWYTPTDLTGSRCLFMDQSSTQITETGLARSSAKLFPADSIMMTSRATIGAISINTGPACTNQGFITCLPNQRVPRSFLYYWLVRHVPLFISHATGATFKEITKGVFKRLPIIVPDLPLVTRFDALVRPMHDMILALERSNRSLANSRDLLLPRLITGQHSIETATRELEAAA